MTKRTMMSLVVLSLLGVAVVPTADIDMRAHEPALRLTGCLLLSRQVGVFALHMEYNRIAVLGHADLASHVRHRVTLTGTFDERADGLRFVVDEVTEIAPTCELQASASGVTEPHA